MQKNSKASIYVEIWNLIDYRIWLRKYKYYIICLEKKYWIKY
uniref:Uncharacterized protein n=1 Tax=Nelumbo nucifera TaxID=4432 RepID=A0A822ZLT5_NELNU|nr:TPA_asm: hypothetical protein HUJ06_004087 [Nelumbo nucifera]